MRKISNTTAFQALVEIYMAHSHSSVQLCNTTCVSLKLLLYSTARHPRGHIDLQL